MKNMTSKSLYQDPEFAKYWNDRAGDKGEPYKRMILDPIMFATLNIRKGSTILELGSGNGYLSTKFLETDPSTVHLFDISESNMNYAREKNDDVRIQYVVQDVTQKWNIPDNSVDYIYSNMLFNEIENIKSPMKEAMRVLKKGGEIIFSVTNPAWDLYIFGQEQLGKKSTKIEGAKGYFQRGYSSFLMGDESYRVEHYQRPFSDYIQSLLNEDFQIKNVIEPELDDEFVHQYPNFLEYKNVPISLIIHASKVN
jgi:ubiquinone/menaquinone biosynthesis C-methylase UbiE